MSAIFWLLVDTVSLLTVYGIGFFYPLYLSLQLINTQKRDAFMVKEEVEN